MPYAPREDEFTRASDMNVDSALPLGKLGLRYAPWDVGWYDAPDAIIDNAPLGKLGLRYAPWDVGWYGAVDGAKGVGWADLVSVFLIISMILVMISNWGRLLCSLHGLGGTLIVLVRVSLHSGPLHYVGNASLEFEAQRWGWCSNSFELFLYSCRACLWTLLVGSQSHRCGFQPLSTSSWRCRSSWSLCKSMRPAWGNSINPPRGKLCGRGAPEAPI